MLKTGQLSARPACQQALAQPLPARPTVRSWAALVTPRHPAIDPRIGWPLAATPAVSGTHSVGISEPSAADKTTSITASNPSSAEAGAALPSATADGQPKPGPQQLEGPAARVLVNGDDDGDGAPLLLEAVELGSGSPAGQLLEADPAAEVAEVEGGGDDAAAEAVAVVVEAAAEFILGDEPGGWTEAAPAPPGPGSPRVGQVDPLEAAVLAAVAPGEGPMTGEQAVAAAVAVVAAEAEAVTEMMTEAMEAEVTEAAAEAEPPPLYRAPAVDLPLAALTARLPAGEPRGPPRAFPPPLDLQRLADALLGEPKVGPVFNELFELNRRRQAAAHAADPSACGPLLYAPRFPRPPGSPPAASLPLLVYLPGIDGTGLAAYRQFPGLAAWFDLRGVFLPPEDRTPFHGLVEVLARQLEDEVAALDDPSRPVYLMGESFGGLLALELAQRVNFVDRLILVNPATSFDRSPWPSLGPLLPALPPDVYRLLPVALSPILSNPVAMAAWNTNSRDPLPQQAVDLLYGLLDLLPELSSLRLVLPPETLGWRLQLLRQGAEAVNGSLEKVRQRTLLLVGEQDLVIPSASEAPRLERALPRCRAVVVPGGSHALLQQASVDLVKLLMDEDFYVSRRRLSRPNTPARSAKSKSKSHTPDGAGSAHRHRRPRPAPGGAAFGTPGPLELPTPGEIRRTAERGGLTTLRRLVSPVFLSTDAATGQRQLGLGALPPPGSGPVLFVGNHQLFAPDMPLMVEAFLMERGQLLRGLAHPTALGMREAVSDTVSAGPGAPAGAFGRLLESFGAVPVSGRNLYKLLQGGEAALLYPGGVREALKMKNEQYELIWPRRAEFVRMACKFGATIIPFAAVGAEDSVDVLLDRRDLLGAPLLGPWLRAQEDRLVKARRGVTESEDVEESFISPLVALKPPARFYYLFGAPIATDPRVGTDRAEVSELYGRVRAEVEDCLGYLLRKREQDPYKDLVPRLLYEASWGGRRQAPTFTP